MRREPIFGLDLVRFCAAFAVLAYHLGFKAFALPHGGRLSQVGQTPAEPAWTPLSWWGWIGVQVFFVISGLVIAYSAEGASGRTFLNSRVARLAPAMLICATVIAGVATLWGGSAPAGVAVLWAKSVTFFPLGPWLSGQFWTLPIEVAFYGVVWLMIVSGVGPRLEPLAWTLALVSALYWAVLSVGELTDGFGRLTQLLMLQHGCYFAIGVWLLLVDRSGLTIRRAALGGLCVATAWLQISAAARGEAPGYGLADDVVVPFVIWLAAVGAMWAALRWKRRAAVLVGQRGGRLLRVLGLTTYPLYLIHMHTGRPVLIEAVRHGASDGVALALAIGASLIAALAVALVLEPPLHRLIAGALERSVPGRGVAAAR